MNRHALRFTLASILLASTGIAIACEYKQGETEFLDYAICRYGEESIQVVALPEGDVWEKCIYYLKHVGCLQIDGVMKDLLLQVLTGFQGFAVEHMRNCAKAVLERSRHAGWIRLPVPNAQIARLPTFAGTKLNAAWVHRSARQVRAVMSAMASVELVQHGVSYGRHHGFQRPPENQAGRKT